MWYIHTVKYCSTIKRKKNGAFYNMDDPWKYANKRIKKKKKNQATEVHKAYESINIHFPL